MADDQSFGVGHDFGRIPVCASVQRSIQPKLKVSASGDRYEQEADQVAARVVRQGGRAVGGYGRAEGQTGPVRLSLEGESPHQTNNPMSAEPETHIAKSASEPGSNLGKPLDAGAREEMGRKLGFDFGNVRIHTDAPAVYLNKGLNARAATHGSDIFFNEGEYDPISSGGRMLLAHELTHVVQQAGMTDGRSPRGMIQRTSVVQVLDEFFSPFSEKTLWVMNSSDNYTRIGADVAARDRRHQPSKSEPGCDPGCDLTGDRAGGRSRPQRSRPHGGGLCAARACVAAEHAAQDLFHRGELLSALALIGAVDTRCRCSRFTSGDAPHSTPCPGLSPQLLNEGRSTDV